MRNQFKPRSFVTTWGMLLLAVGDVGAIVWGFIQIRFLVWSVLRRQLMLFG